MWDYFGFGNETKGIEPAGFGKDEDSITHTPLIPAQAGIGRAQNSMKRNDLNFIITDQERMFNQLAKSFNQLAKSNVRHG